MNSYKHAVREILDRRRVELDTGIEKWRGLLSENPTLKAAYADYQKQAILKAQKQPNELDKARETLKIEFKKTGCKNTDFEPQPHCPLCGDTGYVNGRYCKCVIKTVIDSDKDNLTLPLVDFTQAKRTAPKAISKVYAAAEKYINKFQSGKPFFVIAGSSGTGKTMLAAAMATELMSSGAAVVTVSAFDFVKRAKDYHTQFAIDDYRDLFSPMLDCDMLVIDDLGTETMLKNVTREYLYTVVNERWLRKKCTVITSNLTPAAMLERYGEAIFSRMLDKNQSNSFMVNAGNKRIK